MIMSEIIEAFARENKISETLAQQMLEEAMMTAYKKKFGKDYENLEVQLEKKLGLLQLKTVTETVEDEITQITAEEGLKFTKRKTLELGDIVKIPLDMDVFGRQIAQIVKQILKQRLSDIQKDIIYNEYATKENALFVGKIKSKTDNKRGGYYVSIEPRGHEALLPYSETIPDEQFDPGEMIKVMLLEVKKISKKEESQLILTRRREEFVKELLRQNIPEIGDGTFIIRAIARKPGEVTKVLIDSINDSVDPISVTVGKQGLRIKPIRSELGSERIELIRWNENTRTVIANSIRASRVLKNRIADVYNIELDSETKEAIIVVQDEFLAPLIGKGGSHLKMLEKILSWKIKFSPYSEYEKEIAEKQKQVDQILGIYSDDDEVEIVEDEKIPIHLIPFTQKQKEVLLSAGFEDVADIVEYSIEELAVKCGISPDDAMEIWKVIESSVDIEEEQVE